MTDTNDTPETTDAPEATTTTEQPETFDREYVEKLRKENATYRTKAKQAEEAAQKAKVEAERQKMDDLERLKAEKADAEKKAAETEARAIAAERRATIADSKKVVDASAALKLLDPEKHLAEDGSVNVDALLESYPFLAPQQPTGVNLPGSRTAKSGPLNPATMSKTDFEDLQRRALNGERITL